MELGLTTQSRPISLPGSRLVRLRHRNVCCGAKGYFPHHRAHLTAGGVRIPYMWAASGTWPGRGPRLAPEPATYTEEQLAELLRPEQWQLAYGTTLEHVQATINRINLALARSYKQAKLLRQYVMANWPAWTASFCEDVEYILEYTVGILPAWLVSMKMVLQGILNEVYASAAVQHLMFAASGAATSVRANVSRMQQVAAETNKLASSRLAEAPPLQQLVTVASKLANKEGSNAATNVARGLTHSMAALTAAELAVNLPNNSSRRRGKAALGLEESAANHSYDAAAGGMDSRLQLMGLLPEGVQEGLRSGSEVATSSMQHLIIEPLQQAGFISSSGRSPTLAGIVAAASVVLAASVYRTMQRQEQQAEERMLQQVQLQIKAESLAAQRARFRRALDDSQAGSGTGSAPAVNMSTRRRAASPADVEDWENSLANSSPIMPKAGGLGRPHAVVPELDSKAAQEFHRFMASAKADGVPMWDSHMMDDVPKVSMKELQRQTQKIRSAATDEERAAMEDAETRRQMVEQQLNSQLAELQGAPIGRAAREQWRKEQQAKQKEQEQQQSKSKEQAGANADKCGRFDKAGADFNPFAVTNEARAQWEAEDHLYSDASARKGGAAGARGGWGFGGAGQQQKNTQPKQARCRKFADEPTAAVLPVLGALSPTPPLSSNPGDSSSSSNSKHVEAPAAAAAGVGEGTPGWEAQMREEMIRSGAARRARRQQMMQQQQQQDTQSNGAPPAALPTQAKLIQKGSSSAATTVTPRNLPGSSLQRPSWPGAAASAAAIASAGTSSLQTHNSSGSVAAVGKEHQQQMDVTAAAEPPAAAVAARDVHEITPSIRLPDTAVGATADAAASTEAAAEASAVASTTHDVTAHRNRSISIIISSRSVGRQEGEEGNPFAVDKTAVIDDETAFELGKVVDQETKQIRLQGL